MLRYLIPLLVFIAGFAIVPHAAHGASVGSELVDPDNGVCHAYANPPTPAGVATATADGGVSCAVKPGVTFTGSLYVCLDVLQVLGILENGIKQWYATGCESHTFVWGLGSFSGNSAQVTASCPLGFPIRSETYVTFDNAAFAPISNTSDASSCA